MNHKVCCVVGSVGVAQRLQRVVDDIAAAEGYEPAAMVVPWRGSTEPDPIKLTPVDHHFVRDEPPADPRWNYLKLNNRRTKRRR